MKKFLSILAIALVLFSPVHADDLVIATMDSELVIEQTDGFEYQVMNKETNEAVEKTVEEEDSNMYLLPDGVYVIKEIQRPDGYIQAKDVEITIPYENEEGELLNVIEYSPKHIKEDAVDDDKPEYAQTSATEDVGAIGPIFIIFTVLVVVGGIVLVIVRKSSNTR